MTVFAELQRSANSL